MYGGPFQDMACRPEFYGVLCRDQFPALQSWWLKMEIGGWLARDTIGRLGLGASDSVILLTYMYMRVACRRRAPYVTSKFLVA